MAFFLTNFNKDKKSLGIYIHIPFCRSKCEYCDFYSLGGAIDHQVSDEYLQALANHIKEVGRLSPAYVVDTVYFGGGTPSFFGAENLDKILDEIQKRFHMSPDPEITLEANPDSVNKKDLRRLVRSGFNRISIGVQSCENDMLKKLGRPHTFEQSKEAMRLAREAGFTNISLDLMYGLPGQTKEMWRQTVETVLKMKPEHLSCYALKVEEGTPMFFYKDNCGIPDDDTQADMYLEACAMLRERGYHHYEISNFAKPGFESKHNLKYWNGGEYIGFGPNAASDYAGKRSSIVRDLRKYIDGIMNKGAILTECDTIALRDRAGEYIMLRLRTSKGISADEYEKNYLMPFEPLETLLRRLEKHGFAEKNSDRWRLTEKGWLVSNEIIIELNEQQEQSQPLAKRH